MWVRGRLARTHKLEVCAEIEEHWSQTDARDGERPTTGGQILSKRGVIRRSRLNLKFLFLLNSIFTLHRGHNL